MKHDLHNMCGLAEALLDIPFIVLDTTENIENFTQKYRYHSVQKFLYSSALNTLFEAMHETDLVCLTDPLHISFHFFLLENTPIVFGPYCIDTLSSAEATVLFRQLEISTDFIRPFLAYRSQFNSLSQQQALNYIYGLIHHIMPSAAPYKLRKIGYEERAFIVQKQPTKNEHPYSEIITKRYAQEAELREHIRSGSFTSSLKSIQALRQDVDYLLSIGNRDENLKTAAIIQGTILRIYAVEAGLSPILVDQITNQCMEKQRAAKSGEEKQQINIELTKLFCKEISRIKDKNYDHLVQCVLYHLEHHYYEKISLNQLAKDLNVSYNYMISHFHQKVGTTPNAYLTEIRLKHAEQLILYTKKSITEISMDVGIEDSNYFTKLFKRRYGKPPLQYRKH